MSTRGWDPSSFARLAALLGAALAACLTRPVESTSPDLKTTFTTPIDNQPIDKLDILFMIDNSASMGDKQLLLAGAVPDMIRRLLTPNCVDRSGASLGPSGADGQCPAGGKPEFPPVHDMHIGIVSSSLGSLFPNPAPAYLVGAQDLCDPSAPNDANRALNAHGDDRGELLDRGGDSEAPLAAAQPDHFLAWFPPAAVAPANAGKPPPPVPAETQMGDASQPGTLIGDFTSLISGVHEHGCGFEAQNEAWYRFLVQPDPSDHLETQGNAAREVGLDAVVLRQRAAFLRPDSLVAVIVVTDENEDTYDPLAFAGQGWFYEQPAFPGSPSHTAPEGTAECALPLDPARPAASGAFGPSCTSCALSSVRGDPAFASRCPSDPPGGRDGYLDPGHDAINARFFQPKRRFGVAPYYPVSRYVRGLTSDHVPDRSTEHDGAGNYVGDDDANAPCVNPLFAKNLPTDPGQELCALERGPRTPDLVYYAAITGVPHELLQADRTNPDSPQKEKLDAGDWLSILGRDPEHDDFAGADVHMLESEEPRATSCPPGSADDCDPINGREWSTGEADLQFACTFPLVDPSTGAPREKDCSAPPYHLACDCEAGNPHQAAPLCRRDANGQPTTVQVRAKAYPSLRELEVAKAMGDQGIVSSLCPIHPAPVGGPSDPLFGYRPAVATVVDRLKTSLIVQCLPQKLAVDPVTGDVPCLLLAVLPCATTTAAGCAGTETEACDHPELGLSTPASDLLPLFRDQLRQDWEARGGAASGRPDPLASPVCQIVAITRSDPAYAACVSGGDAHPPGWCYAEGADARGCPRQILFTPGQPPPGAVVALTCLEETPSLTTP